MSQDASQAASSARLRQLMMTSAIWIGGFLLVMFLLSAIGVTLPQGVVQILDGLSKGAAYALIALGLTLIFGTLGVVNFAHGALFMIGAFCAVSMRNLLTISKITIDETQKDFLGNPLEVETPYVVSWFGDAIGNGMIEWAVPLAILLVVPVMLLVGWIMERGLIQHFYKRPHADQILVTFGLAIVLAEVVRYFFGANPIQSPAPPAYGGSTDIGLMIGLAENQVVYPVWRIVYFCFSALIIAAVFAFLQFTTFGMVVRAGMADRETVGMLGIDIDKRFTVMFGIAAAVAGLAGVMYAPILSPYYTIGMDFLVLSFVVVVVGGMGSLPGAVLAGFLLGVLQSFAAMNQVKAIVPGIDQVIIYLVAIIILLARPRGLMGRKGVMED